ncbi:HipA family kinase [Algoriphagus persicinus]|uniref:HipA family kinase n=1 Tax=Algoriphagus persicinus TaxID=3108754 RepID=UPI002B3AAED3|nr:HipA family kinase [Algoriphagus sp. E1-3-M2]MEB2786378.1 HipA family kinase [Algoriphagus sp. E1-3-M2]
MKRLVSIEKVEKKYATVGSHPLLVHASDLEHYICKYPFFPEDHKLINEFLAFHFARLWGIRTPEMNLVILKQEHLAESLIGQGLSFRSIQNPLVGSLQLEDVTEIFDHLAEGISEADLAKYDRKEFLKIALFDIWLSNEDRNTGNINLLLGINESSSVPIAIDHEKIFNSGSPFGKIYELTYEDSMFYTKLFHRLFRSRNKYLRMIEEISSSLESYSTRCFDNLPEIIDDIPAEWGYNSEEIFEYLQQGIFSTEWLDSVKRSFNEFASLMTQRL